MPGERSSHRDAHSALPCLSALHHPILSGRTTPGQGAPLTVPRAHAGGLGCRRAEQGAGVRRARGGRSGTAAAPRRVKRGSQGGLARAAAGAAPVTHILRVPLVHRRQWRPGRHFVRAAGSGRGLAGRAAVRAPGRRTGVQARAEAGRSAPAGRGRCERRPRRAEGTRPRRAGRGRCPRRRRGRGRQRGRAPGARAGGLRRRGAEAPGAASWPR